MKSNLLFIFIFFSLIGSCQKYKTFPFKTGDIIFQSSQSGQSRAVQLATHSIYSHVGIVYIESDQVYVIEAVQPVKKTKIEEWVKYGDDEDFAVKRLKNSNFFAKEQNKQKLYTTASKYLGKNYDIFFNWSDNEIYCSELVWKVYKNAFDIQLCTLRKLKSFDLENQEVKEIMKVRYGTKIPYDEKVVAPSDIFDSQLLVTIKG